MAEEQFMKERYFGIDLVKACACFLVVLVHFASYSGLYVTPIIGSSLFLQVCIRWFAFICVPLFLIATGYLQCEKSFSKKFYRSLLPLLASYVVIAYACFLFRKYDLHEDISYLGVGFLGILNFTAHPYGWYVEMFVGLFVLIPFLNLIPANLKTQKQELLLIGTLLLITSGTSLLKSFTVRGASLDVSTDYWELAYPITYYFIGAYIRKYQPVLTRKMQLSGALAILLILALETVFSTLKNHLYDESKFSGYNSIYTAAVATLFFLFVYRARTNRKAVQTVISGISRRTLDIYLFSYFFDQIYYPIYFGNFHLAGWQNIAGMVIVVPLILASAFAASLVKELIFNGFIKLAHAFRGRPRQQITEG